MLDRKTKNIDASIELLEDRIQHKKKASHLMYLGAIATLIGLIAMFLIIMLPLQSHVESFTHTELIVIGSTGLIFLLLLFAIFSSNFSDKGDFLDLDKQMLELLVYLKRKEKKK